MTRKELDVASYVIFRPVAVLGGLSLMLLVVSSIINTINTVNDSRNAQAVAEEVQRIEEAPITDYFEYISVEPVKEEFAIGEPVRFVSNRNIHKSYSIGGVDTLFCDTYEGDGAVIVSSEKRRNIKPRIISGESAPWKYTGMLPQNPIGVYIEAECYLRAQIEMCIPAEDRGVCKQQQVESSIFKIVNK